MPKKFNTREEWLTYVADGLRPAFAKVGAPVPAKVRFAIGFCSTGERGRRIGECWYPQSSGDQSVEIFIKPDQHEPKKVAHILAHELVHAAVGPGHGHGGKFRTVCKAMGFEGKMTQALPGDVMHNTVIAPILKKAGKLPHAKLQGKATERKKQSTRLLKAECETCGYTVRVTKKWAALGLPSCPVRGHGRMECLALDDEGEGEE